MPTHHRLHPWIASFGRRLPICATQDVSRALVAACSFLSHLLARLILPHDLSKLPANRQLLLNHLVAESLLTFTHFISSTLQSSEERISGS